MLSKINAHSLDTAYEVDERRWQVVIVALVLVGRVVEQELRRPGSPIHERRLLLAVALVLRVEYLLGEDAVDVLGRLLGRLGRYGALDRGHGAYHLLAVEEELLALSEARSGVAPPRRHVHHRVQIERVEERERRVA